MSRGQASSEVLIIVGSVIVIVSLLAVLSLDSNNSFSSMVENNLFPGILDIFPNYSKIKIIKPTSVSPEFIQPSMTSGFDLFPEVLVREKPSNLKFYIVDSSGIQVPFCLINVGNPQIPVKEVTRIKNSRGKDQRIKVYPSYDIHCNTPNNCCLNPGLYDVKVEAQFSSKKNYDIEKGAISVIQKYEADIVSPSQTSPRLLQKDTPYDITPRISFTYPIKSISFSIGNNPNCKIGPIIDPLMNPSNDTEIKDSSGVTKSISINPNGCLTNQPLCCLSIGDYSANLSVVFSGSISSYNITSHNAVKVADFNPSTSITSPINNTQIVLTPPNTSTNITISAVASDPDGTITSVDFYNGNTKLGSVNTPTTPPNSFSFNWNNVSQGNYSFKTIAVDNEGNTGESSIVNVSVVDTVPKINIKFPINDSYNRSLLVGNILKISAEVLDPNDDGIYKVEFYLDSDTAPTCTKLIPESDYTYTCNWFATTGQHLIKVVATDNAGYSKDATKPVFIYDIPEATLVDTTGDLVGVTNLSSDGTFDYHWQLNFDLITPKKINEISFALKDNLGNYVTYHTDPDLGKVIGIGDGLGNWLPKSHTYSVGSNTIHIYANIHPTCTIEMVPFTIVFDDMSVVLVGIGGA